MALLLSIDTALETASVCLSMHDKMLQFAENQDQKDHAAWLHIAIKEILSKSGYRLKNVDAIAVSIGPGSYTGLRIALSTAKGLCYAVNIPLITVSTLEMMANAVRNEAVDWICPVIDARRMEVFTAVYDKQLKLLKEPRATIIDQNSFADLLSNHNLTFCGTAVKKLQSILSHPHASFSQTRATASDLAPIALQHFLDQRFADIVYAEPYYLKDFHTTHKPTP